jgi:hypothetical protein
MKKMLGKQLKRVAMVAGFLMVCSHPASANLCEFDGANVVANQDLDTMRGGFISNNGLQISLGIVKAVSIDGVLQAISTLNIANMPQLTQQLAKLGIGVSSNTQTAQPTAESAANSATPAPATTASSNPVAAQTAAESAAVVSSPQTDTSTMVNNLGNLMVVQNSANNKVIQNVQMFDVIVQNARNVQSAINLSARIREQMTNMFH